MFPTKEKASPQEIPASRAFWGGNENGSVWVKLWALKTKYCLSLPEHCIDFLRQSSMCHGDIGLITFEWSPRNRIPVANATTHQCVNWQRLDDWTKERTVDMLKPGWLVHPTLGMWGFFVPFFTLPRSSVVVRSSLLQKAKKKVKGVLRFNLTVMIEYVSGFKGEGGKDLQKCFFFFFFFPGLQAPFLGARAF